MTVWLNDRMSKWVHEWVTPVFIRFCWKLLFRINKVMILSYVIIFNHFSLCTPTSVWCKNRSCWQVQQCVSSLKRGKALLLQWCGRRASPTCSLIFLTAIIVMLVCMVLARNLVLDDLYCVISFQSKKWLK